MSHEEDHEDGGDDSHCHMCGPMKKEFKLAMFEKKEKILKAELEFVGKVIESRKRSMQRSRSTLRRLVNSNARRWKKPSGKPYPPVFATFTFAKDIRDPKTANKIFSNFIKRLNYEIGGDKKSFLKYVTVTEFQDFSRDGVVHYHTIFFNLRFILSDTLAEIWGHPQCPHEKGTIENRNKAIRRYIKKRSDLSKYSPEQFTEVERKLRDRFMECLKYKTPREAFSIELQKQRKPLVRGMIMEKLLVN